MAGRNCSDADSLHVFQGIPDRFNGILVDSLKEPCISIEHFTAKLTASLKAWHEQKIRGVWFRVALNSSDWVPVLAQHEFWFHHARRESVMMCRWLPEATEKSNIPSYAHTMLSVGGLVTDSQGRLLVVKEKFWKLPNWKLPGGYVENKEDIATAAVREVFEETGLRVRFNSLVGFLHSHTSQFGCSDLYLITHLTPEDESQQIKKCDREIEDCCWMKIEDYLKHREVHKLNKMLVNKFLEIQKQPVVMLGKQVPHPIFTDKQVTIFHLDTPPSSNL